MWIQIVLVTLVLLGLGVAVIGAARKRNRNRNFVAIPIDSGITLSTLANATALSGSLVAALTEDLYCISADLTWSIQGLTPGEGPVYVGVAHGDYSDTEITEALTVSLTGPGNKIEQERSRRLVRRAGGFPGILAEEVLNDGRPLRIKLKFTVQNPKTIKLFAFNRSGAALTTGGIVRVFGDLYGRWLL